jgi:hypothetical protein
MVILRAKVEQKLSAAKNKATKFKKYCFRTVLRIEIPHFYAIDETGHLYLFCVNSF